VRIPFILLFNYNSKIIKQLHYKKIPPKLAGVLEFIFVLITYMPLSPTSACSASAATSTAETPEASSAPTAGPASRTAPSTTT
jgi:hypothetical protein